jgi:hypothetical protein
MHELTRRAYLDTMGIDSYTSRTQLPGAAVSRRLVVVRKSRVADKETTSAVSAPTVSNTAAAFREAANAVKDELGTARVSSSNTTPEPASLATTLAVPAFSLVAITAGGCLWVEEVTNSGVSKNQVHLIRAIAKALALPDGEVEVSQFDWPIHNNSQLDLGAAAAAAALGGFVQRKVDRCGGLVLLGSASQQRLEVVQLELGLCVRTVSTLEMLRQPLLKKQAWQDLQPLAKRS